MSPCLRLKQFSFFKTIKRRTGEPYLFCTGHFCLVHGKDFPTLTCCSDRALPGPIIPRKNSIKCWFIRSEQCVSKGLCRSLYVIRGKRVTQVPLSFENRSQWILTRSRVCLPFISAVRKEACTIYMVHKNLSFFDFSCESHMDRCFYRKYLPFFQR